MRSREEPLPRLAGRVCVVNGAASVIGQAVAERFASEGGVVLGVDQVEHAGQRAVFERNPGALDKRLVHWPMGRFGTLEEAAATIAFLASDDSGFITAAALPLDGGITEAFTVPD
jgi:NAD(P)-dependent dehydrogenase (short-subunit alcohol dehydrogenase family)